MKNYTKSFFHESEDYTGTKHPKILLAESRKVDWEQFTNQLDELTQACHENDIKQIITLLKVIIPEYHSNQMLAADAIIDVESHPVIH